MPRNKKKRTICATPCFCRFSPVDHPPRGTVKLTYDEYEVLRLHDLEHLQQEEVARQMRGARTSVTGILLSAHEKLAAALHEGRQIVLEHGDCTVCEIGRSCPRAADGSCAIRHRCGAVCSNGPCAESQTNTKTQRRNES